MTIVTLDVYKLPKEFSCFHFLVFLKFFLCKVFCGIIVSVPFYTCTYVRLLYYTLIPAAELCELNPWNLVDVTRSMCDADSPGEMKWSLIVPLFDHTFIEWLCRNASPNIKILLAKKEQKKRSFTFWLDWVVAFFIISLECQFFVSLLEST